MFVSSYSTYIQTNTNDKNVKQKDVGYGKDSGFSSKLLKESVADTAKNASLPVDYIARNNNFYTKLFLEKHQDEQSAQTKELTHKFIDQSTLQDAKKAYTQAPKMTSLFRETFLALDKTQLAEVKPSQNTQDFKDAKMRKLMINTYIANENYYKITA
ncbi:MAG: hypothetical protein FP820_10620 [Sulfurimonas sp.]|nr:hypothetical protein [Sulfurimonas sp.]MBU3938746.1 hypothetical protein [bacterium]MBU4025030.1 hypothetical protein [bacterium]MBU4058525.1 hypothetical protein [bacterium]MBU4111484.1 hypothetical protein [bacterium]